MKQKKKMKKEDGDEKEHNIRIHSKISSTGRWKDDSQLRVHTDLSEDLHFLPFLRGITGKEGVKI